MRRAFITPSRYSPPRRRVPQPKGSLRRACLGSKPPSPGALPAARWIEERKGASIVLRCREMVELTSAIAWEHYRGRFNQALGIQPLGFSEAFCVLPER